MAITRGAKKAHRSSLRKRVFNERRQDKITRAVKAFRKLITAGNIKDATLLFKDVQSALDKAVKGKTIKKNTAARIKSRLSKLLKKLG